MPKLTKNDLEDFLEAQNLALPNASAISRLYGLATEVLIHLLGGDWVVNNVFGKRPLDDFLRSRPKSKEDQFKMTDRLVEVAEMLFNFQIITGIENIFERIKNDSIEACVAELQSARLLHFDNIPFYFNTPSNQKGNDYDVVATTKGFQIACEFKCKIEETIFSENTIKQLLGKARKQLPNEKPSVIFVKIPEIWTTQKDVQESFSSVLNNFFRSTSRINSIVYYWEEWNYLQTGQALRAIRFNEIINPNSKVEIGKILKKPKINESPANWIHFSDLVQNKFGKTDLHRPKPVKTVVLSNGFSWHAVLRILPQISKGEHVIYDIGSVSGTRISLLLDDSNFIRFRIVDANLNKFEVKTNEQFYKIGLDDFSYLRFQLTPKLNYSEISIAVNNKVVGKKTVLLNQNSLLLPNTSLGGDLNGRKKTAFEVASIAVYEKSSFEINTKLTEHYNLEFALKIPI